MAWKIWVDTGGTFTDCIAVDPEGRYHRSKVLSSSALRGSIVAIVDERHLKIYEKWGAPDGFINGFILRLLGIPHETMRIFSFDAAEKIIELDRSFSFPDAEAANWLPGPSMIVRPHAAGGALHNARQNQRTQYS